MPTPTASANPAQSAVVREPAVTCNESPTYGPTNDDSWSTWGLRRGADEAIFGRTIVAYQIQWHSGAWSSWFVPGKNDLDKKTNAAGRPRRFWSYFADHNFKMISCALPSGAPVPPMPPAPPTPPAPPAPPPHPGVPPGPIVHTPSREQLIEACASVFRDDGEKRRCAEVAIREQLSLGVIASCGRHYRYDSERRACLATIALLRPAGALTRPFSPEATIDACVAAFRYESERTACLKTAVAGDVSPTAIATCQKHYRYDSDVQACLKLVAARPGPLTSRNRRPDYRPEPAMDACGAAFRYDSDRKQCMSVAMAGQLEASSIASCSKNYRYDSEKHACLKLLVGDD